jgi:hypothetical protein
MRKGGRGLVAEALVDSVRHQEVSDELGDIEGNDGERTLRRLRWGKWG